MENELLREGKRCYSVRLDLQMVWLPVSRVALDAAERELEATRIEYVASVRASNPATTGLLFLGLLYAMQSMDRCGIEILSLTNQTLLRAQR